MKNQNHNENHLLDKFLENEYENNPQTNQQHYHSHQPAASYTPAYPRHKHNRKNTAVIALLSAIFVVGVAILAIQLFRPMNTVNNKENMTGGNRSDNPEYFYMPDNGAQGDGGPQFNQGPDNGQPHIWGPGPSEGEGDGGIILKRRNEEGKTEYSTDGGKTWQEDGR